jgi:hypothetical protein
MGKFCSIKCRPREREANPNWKGGTGTIRPDGYRLVKASGHSRANKEYVLEHWLVAEKALGKALPPKAVVHHVNNSGSDNNATNLVICENQGYHALLHLREKIKSGKLVRNQKGQWVRLF